MINTKLVQNAYINLYTNLRNYIWDFNSVEKIAELETVSFTLLPDVDNLKRALSEVKLAASRILYSDDKLLKSFEKFENMISDGSTPYVKLNSVREVII